MDARSKWLGRILQLRDLCEKLETKSTVNSSLEKDLSSDLKERKVKLLKVGQIFVAFMLDWIESVC